MKKYIFITAFFLACLASQAQKTNRDSLRMDSLKKVLPSLKGVERIDCLNALVENFLYGSNRKAPAVRYDSIAYAEATKIGYKKGIAISLLIMAAVEGNEIRSIIRKTGKQPPEKVASYVSKVTRAKILGEEINDYRIMSLAYGFMADGFYEKYDAKIANDLYKKAIDYAQRSGYIVQERSITAWLGDNHFFSNNLEDGFEYYKRAVILARKTVPDNDYGDWLSIYAFYNMAELYTSIGDYETALSYYREGALYAQTHNSDWLMENEIGSLYFKINQFDSSLFYFRKFISKRSGLNSEEAQVPIYIMTKEYDKALKLSKLLIDSLTVKRRWGGLYGVLMMAGRANFEKKNYKEALKYTADALRMPQITINGPWKMDACKMMSNIFHQLGKYDSAYYYLSEYTILRDSLLKNQFLWKLNDFKSQVKMDKKEAELSLLSKNNKIKEEQLKQEGLIKKALIAGLILFVITGIFIFRTLMLKRKNEKLRSQKQQAELQQKATELKMQALRAQMNPHFIFNCLSSINSFIIKNESKIASGYLTRFSRLIRMVLINSQKTLIALEDELQMLRLYLDMERLRFKDSFDYRIIFLNTMDADNIFIPHLLLQPFCENAIWHGLMNKDDKGHLTIELSMENNMLYCTITDNGIGREKAEEIKSKSAEKKKSMGLKITTERLALLNMEKGVNTFYEIVDILDEQGNVAGTKVNLKISYKESVEEIA